LIRLAFGLSCNLTNSVMLFVTRGVTFCYTKMAFGLKNGGATYQKCIHIILDPHIRRNFEAYIDDVALKSKKYGDLLDDLKETFDNLCKYKMVLNSKNMCSVYHQENCSVIWYCLGESMRT
jgi:hypothetical protein